MQARPDHGATVALTVVLLSAAVCWTGWNRWPYLSDLDVPWHDIAPLVLGLPLWNLFLLGAAVAAVGGAAIAVWLRGQDWLDPRTFFVTVIVVVIASLVVDVLAVRNSRVPYASDVELPEPPRSGGGAWNRVGQAWHRH